VHAKALGSTHSAARTAQRVAHSKRTTVRPAAVPTHATPAKPAKRTERTAAAYKAPQASLPAGILSTESLVPTAKKLPFLAVALVGLAILLLAAGALPAGLVPSPAFAEALVERRALIAFGGFATLVAAIAAYLLV
jgi:hypothetical protein